MLIFVNSTLTGKTFSLDVESNDPVSIIKSAIYGHEGVQPEDQYLILAGKKLSDRGTLAENNVQKDCTVYLDAFFTGERQNRGWRPYSPPDIALVKKHNLNKMICRKCYGRLHPRAVNCRKKKCGHTKELRPKSTRSYHCRR